VLKVGNDHFEATHLEPKVEVCNRRYIFDARTAAFAQKRAAEAARPLRRRPGFRIR
jgi:murein L,D-transpeptidase YafK